MATSRWQQYQIDVGTLLAELGFETEIENKITSARGVTHEVDVSARRVIAGIETLWIVECKLWRNKIGKEKVAALNDICQDLGADRGLLLSEAGFQSGALKHASGRSITLTSIEDLRANAAADLLAMRVRNNENRLRILERVVNWPPTRPEPEELLGMLYMCQSEADRARVGRLPTASTWKSIEELGAMVDQLLYNRDVSAGDSPFTANVIILWIAMFWTPIKDAVPSKTLVVLRELVHGARHALDRGISGRWPVLQRYDDVDSIAAWSMEQLLGVIEPTLISYEEHPDVKRVRSRLEEQDRALMQLGAGTINIRAVEKALQTLSTAYPGMASLMREEIYEVLRNYNGDIEYD